MSFVFAQPWALLAAPLPLLVYWLLPPAPAAKSGALRLPLFGALLDAGPSVPAASRGLLALAVLAWLLLLAAAARPQWLGEPLPVPLVGRDLMLAVDISGSMAEEDMLIGARVVDRLTAVKAVAGDFIERRAGDRIGLILFGENAYVQTPLTFDRNTARMLLFEAAIGLAGRETAIGDAIGLAVKRLRDRPVGQAVLILLTDGANTAGNIAPARAAQLAAAAGARIYTIGVGADPRGPFGLALGASPLDETSLIAMADATGGRYFRARDVRELQAIYALLDELEPVAAERMGLRPVEELFAWPLALALLLSLAVAIGRGAAWPPEFGVGRRPRDVA